MLLPLSRANAPTAGAARQPEVRENMTTRLHWIDGPWPDRVAISARPRGGDWLADEIRSWRAAGVDVIVSLLTPNEVEQLDLRDESALSTQNEIIFVNFPIEDRTAPSSEAEVIRLIQKLENALSEGKNVVIHCRQGIGRAGLIAASLFIERGESVENALQRISATRGVRVPETAEQRAWIEEHALALSGAIPRAK